MEFLENLPIGIVDLVVLGVILISALLSYFRGFMREVLSILAWVGAAVATVYGYPYAIPYVVKLIDVEPFTTIAASTGIFVASLIVLSILSNMVSGSVKESGTGSVDRALGFVFGLARGGLVICLLYLAATWIWEESTLPPELAEARSLPLAKQGAEALLKLMPEDIQDKARTAKEEAQQTADDLEQAQELYQRLNEPLASGDKAASDGEEPAYDATQRQQLDSLIKQAE